MASAHWTAIWKAAVSEERARQWVYDGSAREAAQAKGLIVIDAHATDDVVLAESDAGALLAVGTLRESDIFVIDIER